MELKNEGKKEWLKTKTVSVVEERRTTDIALWQVFWDCEGTVNAGFRDIWRDENRVITIFQNQ